MNRMPCSICHSVAADRQRDWVAATAVSESSTPNLAAGTLTTTTTYRGFRRVDAGLCSSCFRSESRKTHARRLGLVFAGLALAAAGYAIGAFGPPGLRGVAAAAMPLGGLLAIGGSLVLLLGLLTQRGKWHEAAVLEDILRHRLLSKNERYWTKENFELTREANRWPPLS